MIYDLTYIIGPPVRPQPVPTGKPKVKPVPTGKPKVKPVPIGKPRVTPVSTGKPQVSTPFPTGRTNRPFPVLTDRGYSPSETPFLATKDERIFDSGCSRSMNGNKERLDYFQAFHGGKVTFRGGEGRITRKGTIHTECLVLSKDFKLPDDSMVVLKVTRKHNLYTINLNDLCPRGNLACLMAHASLDESMKWHRQMAHVNCKNMNRLVKENLVRGLPPKLFKNGHTCVACCKGKQHKASYKDINAVNSIYEPLQLLHMDLFGPTLIRSINHKFYCLLITDGYSRFCWVFCLEHKDETCPILKNFINLVENQLNKKVKTIRCEYGTEFKNAHMIKLCGSKGIKREYSNPRTPQQNRVAETKNRTLIEAARTMLADSKLPTIFWTKAVRTPCYVLNRVSLTSPHNQTPYALLTRNIPYVSHFNPFVCHVTILNTSDHLGKFDGKADEGYIVGYSASHKAYRVYNVPNKRVEESMNLRFLEEKPNVQGLGHEWYFDLDYLIDSLGYKHVTANQPAGTQGATPNSAGIQADDSDSDCDELVIIIPSYPSHSRQETQPIDTPGGKVDDSPFQSADKIFQKKLERLKDPEQRVTSDAVSLGLRFANNDEELRTPAGAKAILPGCLPVFTGSVSVPTGSVLVPTGTVSVLTGSIPVPVSDTKVSTDDVPVLTSSSPDLIFDNEPTTRFSCPSDLGNHDPSPGIFSSSSYDDEFDTALNNVASSVEVSPVATKQIHTVHPQSLILEDHTSAVQMRSKVQQTTTVEPRSVAQDLEDPSWVDAMQEEMQPFKFQNVWVLVDLPSGKYTIGTKWILKNKRDARGIVVRNKARLVAQGHRQEEGIDYDEVFAPVAIIEAIKPFLAFASYMGFLVYQMDVKSLQVQQRPDGIFIHQDKYVKEILNKFDLGSVRMATTPYEAPKPKSKNESNNLVNVHLYRSMIGSLMYLTASRPDIMFAVSAYSRHQVTPTTSNLEAVKKIFNYLKGQPKLGLWYPKESPFVLEAYSDSDYAGAIKDRKSTTSGCQFLGRRLISWQCKKQTIVATSSTEAEYVTAANCCG
uniref:Putative ribonuclease H-like domain-containing protein n=1 Tax=Tanacetum cinerariifolium TaxID=118510 RepID=A0A6L2JD39_TANCI|nr:putative ribonuclease H-like domain-containing protein [Tanacetum cinerariifolium]